VRKIPQKARKKIQIFEGLVIKANRKGSQQYFHSPPDYTSGVGVEKTYAIHSPNILKVEVVRRSKEFTATT